MGFFDAILRWFGGDNGGTAVLEPESDLPVERQRAESARKRSSENVNPENEENDDVDGDVERWWAPENAISWDAIPEPASIPPTESELYDQLTQVVRSPELELPRLPQVAQRALMLLREDNVNYRQLSTLVEQDPVLTAEVLRIANSVLYRGTQEIIQLEHAFSRLGMRQIRSIVLAANMKSLAIRTGGETRTLGEELWQRSIASAVMMSRFASLIGAREDDLFLVGLLHDIGNLVILRAVHDFEKKRRASVSRAVFDAICAQWHEHLGLRLASNWGLPDPLPDLIGSHHSPPTDDDPNRDCRLLVALADACCALLGYAPRVPFNLFELPCAKAIGLRDDEASRKLLSALPNQVAERIRSV